jgi:hypothetical protein
VFLNDAILFTGHENSSIIIWKVKNKNTLQNFNERVSYVFNNNRTKSFLNEYYYNYDFDLEDKNYNIQECELRRKFEIVNQIKMEEDLNNLSISFMKMSKDMSYMILIDNKKDIYVLSNFDDYNEQNINNNNNNNNNINMNNNTGVFGYFKENKKIYCISCCKEIDDSYYRASRIQSLVSSEIENSIINEEDLYSSKIEEETGNDSRMNIDNKEKEEERNNNIDYNYTNYICEECKLKFQNTESYLYNY